MVNELNKEMDVDKYKIRSWSKDNFSTLAKYLNNKKIWDSTKAPGFTLLGIKLGVYLPITDFQRLLRKDRLSDL